MPTVLPTPARTVRVAAVQMECEPLQRDRNLERAAALVEQAASQGAQIVLLPELMPGGYLLTEEMWQSAEPPEGPSVAWLRRTARRFGIHLGTSLLEAEGTDFYNAFYLATGQGEIAGRVRKNPPASIEAYFYRAGSDPHVIETKFGRLGIGICYENLLGSHLMEMYGAAVDLVLQPTSAATPTPAFPFRAKDARAFEHMLASGTAHTARALGVPVVMANKCGRLVTPLPGGFPAQDTRFPGLSTIADARGEVKAALGGEGGVIVAEVMLDPALKASQRPRCYGRWSMPTPWYAFLWPLSQRLGERSYARNPRRRKMAQAAAG
ncbi:MAG: carbon-nitrogen hydrolase family protein [Magnetospirillum sp.]|nr:carbon-nitrogen hydrolase family protein [Magnetospirillum sp.]